jgi:hypothetical protein
MINHYLNRVMIAAHDSFSVIITDSDHVLHHFRTVAYKRRWDEQSTAAPGAFKIHLLKP